jgi:glucose-6-phosphate dehydrogenase assembly protein OpcA
MTLVVATESESDAMTASETLGELMHEHPSRAIVLRPSAKDGELEARVFAQCWMPFGKRQQICCEQVEITASMDRVAEVQGTVLGIMVPDLPMVLWIRGEHWLKSEGFASLFPLARKVVIDSTNCSAASLRDHFDMIRGLEPRVKLLGDLAWTRLTSFREVIAHTFEDHGLLGRLKDVESIEIEYTSHPVSAAYLAGWLKSASTKATVSIHAKTGDFDRVVLKGPGVDFLVELGTPVRFHLDGFCHRALLPAVNEVSLMREELSILGPDRVFRAALAVAETL